MLPLLGGFGNQNALQPHFDQQHPSFPSYPTAPRSSYHAPYNLPNMQPAPLTQWQNEPANNPRGLDHPYNRDLHLSQADTLYAIPSKADPYNQGPNFLPTKNLSRNDIAKDSVTTAEMDHEAPQTPTRIDLNQQRKDVIDAQKAVLSKLRRRIRIFSN
ncbi:unnamed protein product [Dracunculus medinensis]|uniref:Uncharacterized protein n=1 Tax=Dracunculus medinensis TaxID=318479 RepID=A0A0N4U8U7_DRAME|nr:unnamed protein product [Dracunculus medinensis]